MEEKIKEIISLYTKIPAAQINAQTIIDRSAVASSILLHRMYAGLQQEGFAVDNYWEVKNYGSLLQRLNGAGNAVTITEQPVPYTMPSSGNEYAGTEAGVGIDVEAIASMPVTNDFREDAFYAMNFTGAEIAYCILQPSCLASFAGLFAAKEAIVKADNSYQNKPFHTISIDHLPGGKPVHPGFQLSISHTNDLAIAVAVRATAPGAFLSSAATDLPTQADSNKTALWLALFATIFSAIALLLLLCR